jgi:hypothetical protein
MPFPSANFTPPATPSSNASSASSTATSTTTTVATTYFPPARFTTETRTSRTEERNSFADAATLNATAQKSKPTALSNAARNKAKPLIYGTVYTGTSVIDAWGGNGAPLTIVSGIGMGLLTSVIAWYVNDAPPPVTAVRNYLRLGGISTPSAFLSSHYGSIGVPFTDTFFGDALMAVTIDDDGTFKSFPSISVKVNGRMVFDPRRPDHDIANPQTWSFTRNSALIAGDFGTSGYARYTGRNPRYGMAQRMNLKSLIDAANWCDELLGLSVTEPRCRTDLIMLAPATDKQWMETLRTMMDSFIDMEAGVIKFIPDRPRSPVFSLSSVNVQSILYHNLLDISGKPTSVEVQYVNTTDPTALPPPQSSVVSVNPVTFSTSPNSAQQVALQGCSRVGQALRHARKRRIALETAMEELGVVVFDEALAVQKADVADVNLPEVSIFGENFTVDRKRSLGDGSYELHLTNYRPYANDDSVTKTQPTYSPPSQYTCETPPFVSDIKLTQLNRIEDGVCLRRLAVEWQIENAACVDYYRFLFAVNGVLQPPVDLPTNEYLSPPYAPGTALAVSITPVAGLTNPVAGNTITGVTWITGATC